MKPQTSHVTDIRYNEATHRFIVSIDGKDLERDAVSWPEAEALIEAYLRRERLLAQIDLPTEKLALSVTEVATTLGVGRKVISDMVASGELPSFRLEGTRTILVPIHALRAWMDDQVEATRNSLRPDPTRLLSRDYNRRA